MNRVGIIGHGITPFSKDDQKIETVLLNSAKKLFKSNPEINRKDVDDG